MDRAVQSGRLDALITRARPGRPRKVKLERVRDLLVPVLENPAQAGQVHRTGVKIHGYLKEQLSLELGYRTAVRNSLLCRENLLFVIVLLLYETYLAQPFVGVHLRHTVSNGTSRRSQ